MNEQARRYIPPNQVRYPADRQFASSCSPPRLATTQLLSASGSWLAPARTSTVLCVRLHGRTHSGVRRNPTNGSAKPERTVEYPWIPGSAFAGSPGMTASRYWLKFIANQKFFGGYSLINASNAILTANPCSLPKRISAIFNASWQQNLAAQTQHRLSFF